MNNIAAFLKARLDDDETGLRMVMEREAREAMRLDFIGEPLADRMLRQVAAMRAIVDMWNGTGEPAGRLTDDWSDGYREGERSALKPILLAFAAIWADHPDYQQEWKPAV